jgi:uncharacterized protein
MSPGQLHQALQVNPYPVQRGERGTNENPNMSEHDQITNLLNQAKTIAVVGLSDSPMRPSHGVAAYLQSAGYHIIPVNPTIRESLGEKAYSSLSEVPEKIDIVDIFRRSEQVGPIVDEAIKLGVKSIWMQEGVFNDEAAERARKAGIFVVQDLCILKEHRIRARS